MSKAPRHRNALTPPEKTDAREALRLIAGTGLTLTDCARRALFDRSAIHRVSLNTAADRFTLQLVKTKVRGSTIRWYDNKLSPMLAALGERMMDDITRADILAVGSALDVSESTRASYYRAIRAVWRWARNSDPPLAGADVTNGLPTTPPRADAAEIGILSIDDTAAILAGAGQHRSALALMLFAGLRPQELWGIDKPPLCWKHILCDERLIRVPAEIAKTRRPRIIEGLPDALWAWLEPGPVEANVTNSSSQWVIRVAQLAAGFSEKQKGVHRVLRPWPHDATRHSFATYALALTGDPGRVALWLGHEGNPRMLYTHYRGLATKAEAEKYFALRPSAATVVS